MPKYLDMHGLETLTGEIENTYLKKNQRGAAGGVSSLNSSGKVPSSQLPDTGTSDYSDLTNKPQINGTTLSGNKTSANLGIHDIPSGGTTGQVLAKSSDSNYAVQWVNQQGGGGGTTDYTDLDNKPQINGTTLSGNKTTANLGIHDVPAGGTAGQVLAKVSGTDHDVGWTTPAEPTPTDEIVVVSDTTPTDPDARIWFPETPPQEVQIPTYSEFQEVAQDVSELKTQINSALNKKIADGVYQLDFIEADGTQFFNTGINPTSTTGFEIDFLNNKTPSSTKYGNLIGSRISSGNNDIEVSTYTPNNNFSGIFRAGSSTNTTARLKVGQRQKITYKNGVFDVDGVSVSVTNTITSNNNPIYLLSLNTNGTTTYPLNARLYRAKIFSGDTVVRDFVPAYSEDYGIGLYDLIGNEFYSNAATIKNKFVYQFYISADSADQKFTKLKEEDEETRQEIKYITDNNPPYKRMIIGLEMGGYDSDGDEQEDSTGTRWRTPNYIYVSDMADTTISVPSGYSMYVCEYSAGNTFIERGTWGSGSIHNVRSLYSIRYTIVKSSWTPMTEEEADVVLIKQKIQWYEYLATGVNPLSVYPDYYDTQIKSVAANYKNDMLSVGANGDGFVFMSDVHWNGNYKHSPNLIYYLKENTNLNLILCGGDLIDRSTSSKASQIADMQNCVKAFKQIGIPFLTAIGNHERNSAGVTDSSLYLTENEVFSITQNHVNWMPLHYANMENRICFYYDKTATKTRYIFIDSGQNNIGTFDITDEEITWVSSVIGSTPSDYHIIVIVHSLGEYQSLNDPVSESNPFVYTDGAASLLETLDGLLSSHMIEAVFVGHTHVDNNDETTGGIPIIWVNSDAKWQYHGMTQPSDGTVDAQCFDVVTMDYANKTIKLRRVGRGSDRTITYGS